MRFQRQVSEKERDAQKTKHVVVETKKYEHVNGKDQTNMFKRKPSREGGSSQHKPATHASTSTKTKSKQGTWPGTNRVERTSRGKDVKHQVR